MSDKYLFYIGKGKGSLIGVPARDLTYEEARQYDIVHLLASGLYTYNTEHAIPKEFVDDLNIEKPKKIRRKKESE